MFKRLLIGVFIVAMAATGSVTGASGPGEIVMDRSDEEETTYEPATFPHWSHSIRYRCYVCHPVLFKMTRMELKKGLLKEDRQPIVSAGAATAAEAESESAASEDEDSGETVAVDENEGEDGAKTPEDAQRAMHGPEGCGLCHRPEGPAFNVEFKACARCHKN